VPKSLQLSGQAVTGFFASRFDSDILGIDSQEAGITEAIMRPVQVVFPAADRSRFARIALAQVENGPLFGMRRGLAKPLQCGDNH